MVSSIRHTSLQRISRKDMDNAELEQKLLEISRRLDILTKSRRVDICSKNYRGNREHKWQWYGHTHVQQEFSDGGIFFVNPEPPRHGVYQRCVYCLSENWADVEGVAAQEAGIPLFRTEDKVIFRYEKWDYNAHQERVSKGMQEYQGVVTQVYLSAGYPKNGMNWRYNVECTTDDKGTRHTFSPLAEDLELVLEDNDK